MDSKTINKVIKMDLINKKSIERLNNFELMKRATIEFMQFAYFLEQERNYKHLNLNIGYFYYDDWKANIYCILDESGIYFKHVRTYDEKEWSGKTLLEQFAFALEFETTKFNFNFDIINQFYNILNKSDKNIYNKIYVEVLCKLW